MSRAISIRCDHRDTAGVLCGNGYTVGTKPTPAELEAQSKAFGWDVGGPDLCPDHARYRREHRRGAAT